MPTVLVNVGLLLWVGLVWTACGFGFVRAMLPRRGRWEAVLLAPLVGLCLLGFLGLLELAVLYVPLKPWLNAAALGSVSAALAVTAGRRDRASAGLKPKHLAVLCLVPLLCALALARVYQPQGFHLLLGSQDQIQYCDNARHILESMNTGTEDDVPVARQDHLVADFCTRHLPYLKAYRRGAEVTLATTAAVTGVSPEAAFPVTVGAGLLTLGLSLAFLGRCLLRLRLAACVLLQLLVLGGNHVTLLHYQGSLAHLLALPMFLLVLPVSVRAVRTGAPSWRLLSGLLCGSLLSFYHEPTAVVLFAPLGLYVGWRLCAARRRGRLLFNVLTVALIAAAVSPLGSGALFESVTKNLEAVRKGVKSPASAAPSQEPPRVTHAPFWAQTAIPLGVASYYDDSARNVRLMTSYGTPAWRGCAACGLLWVLGALGLLRRRGATTRLFALVLLAWAGAAFVFVHTGDYLRFFRAVQYSLPYALVGLVLLTRAPGRPVTLTNWPRWPLVGAVRLALVLFLSVNLFTLARTARYTRAHDAHNDPVVYRFDDTSADWVALRRQLADSGGAPVLLSGFRDTIRPHILSIGTRPAPHFLGDSIARFWPLPKLQEEYRIDPDELYRELGTRMSPERFRREHARQRRPWAELTPEYLERSVQAMVPPGHGYPEEWEAWSDVLPPLVVRGHPYCDVVYKTRTAATLASAGDRQRDERGPYRLLGPVSDLTLRDATRAVRLVLRHDGGPGDVEVAVNDVPFRDGAFLSPYGPWEMSVVVPAGARVQVRKTGAGDLKLRKVSLDPVK